MSCGCGLNRHTTPKVHNGKAAELTEHMDYEERYVIPLLPAAMQRRILADHDRFRASMNAGIYPNKFDLDAHAATERLAFGAAGLTHKEL